MEVMWGLWALYAGLTLWGTWRASGRDGHPEPTGRLHHDGKNYVEERHMADDDRLDAMLEAASMLAGIFAVVQTVVVLIHG